jgi:hypothetical protein
MLYLYLAWCIRPHVTVYEATLALVSGSCPVTMPYMVTFTQPVKLLLVGLSGAAATATKAVS